MYNHIKLKPLFYQSVSYKLKMLSYRAVLYVCAEDAIPISIIINDVGNAVDALEAIEQTYPNNQLVSLTRQP